MGFLHTYYTYSCLVVLPGNGRTDVFVSFCRVYRDTWPARPVAGLALTGRNTNVDFQRDPIFLSYSVQTSEDGGVNGIAAWMYLVQTRDGVY